MNLLRFAAALALGLVLLLGFWLAAYALLFSALSPEGQALLQKALYERAPALLLLVLLLVGVLGLMLKPLFLGYLAASRALAREAEVILEANPKHRLRLKGPWELRELGQLINRLAERHEAREEELKARIEAAKRTLLEERNRLAALLGQLPQGVILANRLGQVVLYNPIAKGFLPGLALGKSLYGLLDRHLLVHALEAPGLPFRLEDFRLQALKLEEAGGGFVLMLTQPEAEQDLGALFRQLRARTGALRSLAEVLPRVPPAEQGPFLALLQQEAERLAELLRQEEAPRREAQSLKALALALARALEDRLGFAPGLDVSDESYVAVDRAALLQALGPLAREAEGFYIQGRPWKGLARLELFPVAQVPPAFLQAVSQQGGEAWLEGERLVLLLPSLAEPPTPASRAGERPPTFDLRLLEPPARELLQRPLRSLLYTAFDLETTGLDPERDGIIAIGAVRLLGDRLLEESFEALADPGRPIPMAATQVHGLTWEDLQGKPRLEEVLPQFYRFQEETLLLAHNGAFDLAFLQKAGQRQGLAFRGPLLDTLLLGQVLFPEASSHSLEALCARFGVPVLGRHTALGDTLMTAEVFCRMLPLLEGRGLVTLGQALEAMGKTPLARLRYA